MTDRRIDAIIRHSEAKNNKNKAEKFQDQLLSITILAIENSYIIDKENGSQVASNVIKFHNDLKSKLEPISNHPINDEVFLLTIAAINSNYFKEIYDQKESVERIGDYITKLSEEFNL